ncbi:MAG: flagellar hook-length control protein FliK [Gudongella sp.]|nr:flagellar hook-length control protein FliK [Gudongella sp.]
MEMMTVSSQQKIITSENSSGKKEAIAGVFESILKSIIPKEENSEQKKETEAPETLGIPILAFMTENTPIPVNKSISETSVADFSSLKAPVESSVQNSENKVQVDANSLEGIAKEVTSEDLFTKAMTNEIATETGVTDKTKELLSQNLEVKESSKATKTFTFEYKGIDYIPKTEAEKTEGIILLGKSTGKSLETELKPSLRASSEVEKQDNKAFFSQVKVENPLKVEVEAPIVKSSQDNISKVQDAMIKLFETTTEGETTRMKISLQPENLGKVDIGLKMENGKLTASIIVENNQVRDLFTNKLSELNQSLAKQNLVIDKINIEVKNQGVNLEMNMNHQGNFNQQGKRQQENRMSNIFKNEYKKFNGIESFTFDKGVSILA